MAGRVQVWRIAAGWWCLLAGRDGIVRLNTWDCWCDPRRCVQRESHLLDVRTLMLLEKLRCVIWMVTLV